MDFYVLYGCVSVSVCVSVKYAPSYKKWALLLCKTYEFLLLSVLFLFLLLRGVGGEQVNAQILLENKAIQMFHHTFDRIWKEKTINKCLLH